MPSREYEIRAQREGYSVIAGVDEAGRGPLAGPVVAAACILPLSFTLEGLDDSKRLTPKKREALFGALVQRVSFGLGIVSSQEIDEINILRATLKAMQIAVSCLPQKPDFVLVDGKQLPDLRGIACQGIVNGDAISESIAAASIIAKVNRDRLMVEYAAKYPGYGFERHMGYGTPEHLEALAERGPCPIHRRTFAPCKEEICSEA